LYRLLYPDGLLDETHRTLDLLFPYDDVKATKRVGKIARRKGVDIEARIEEVMDEDRRFQLKHYPYYGERLKRIQEKYDEMKPASLKQWWYDRRKREEWAAFMLGAIVIFVLTVVFGIISSVTGILQVSLARKPS